MCANVNILTEHSPPPTPPPHSAGSSGPVRGAAAAADGAHDDQLPAGVRAGLGGQPSGLTVPAEGGRGGEGATVAAGRSEEETAHQVRNGTAGGVRGERVVDGTRDWRRVRSLIISLLMILMITELLIIDKINNWIRVDVDV